MSRTVIHRDRTFEYNGHRYQVLAGQDYDGTGRDYSVSDLDSGAEIRDGFDTLRDVRRFVDECRENGWPLEDDPDSDYAQHRVWNHG